MIFYRTQIVFLKSRHDLYPLGLIPQWLDKGEPRESAESTG